MKLTKLFFRVLNVIGLFVFVIIALVAWSLMFPPTYEVEYVVPSNNARLVAGFRPMHPFLAEYERSIIVFGANGNRSEAKLSADTGGYARGQLYEGMNGMMYLKGYSDRVQINTNLGKIEDVNDVIPQEVKYLGAFDISENIGLTFLPASESPEKPLKELGE